MREVFLLLGIVALYAVIHLGYQLWKENKKKRVPFKLALDIHGVSDQAPEFFAELTHALIAAGCEVHILTGSEQTDKVEEVLKEFGIEYTHFFSITDYHKSIGTEVTYLSPGNPVIDAGLWNTTKADYCRRNNIGMCIDDSDVYGDFFTTPYMQVIVKRFNIK